MLFRRQRLGRIMRRFHLILDGLVKLAGGDALGAPLVVETDVDDDAIKPGVETRAAVKVFQVSKRFQERLLRQILGLLAIAGEAKGDMVGLLFDGARSVLRTPGGRPFGPTPPTPHPQSSPIGWSCLSSMHARSQQLWRGRRKNPSSSAACRHAILGSVLVLHRVAAIAAKLFAVLAPFSLVALLLLPARSG